MYLIIEIDLPLSTLKVECPWFSTISSKKKSKFYWKCLFVLPSSTQYMQLSLLLFLHNLLCFHLSRALGSRCLSLVPLCGSVLPCRSITLVLILTIPWDQSAIMPQTDSWTWLQNSFLLFRWHISEVLKSKATGFQAYFTSSSELKYFLYCSLAVSSFLQLFSYFFGILSIILWTLGASTYIQRLSKNIRSLYVFFVSWVSNWPYFL